MAGEDINSEVNGGHDDSQDRSKRFRSEIEFPYSDLENAIEVAGTVHSRAGTSCEPDELAAWMNQSASGGTFRSRLSAARLFGLVETGQGRVTITPLGRQILDPNSARAARVEAFLKVPLYSAMYEQNRGNVLPPAAALERQMLGLGVSPKQTERARQTFAKSAHYAGFIDAATGRFIRPGNTGGAESESKPDRPSEAKRWGGGDGGSLDDLHPFIIGLLRTIPPAQVNQPKPEWPISEQVKWLQTAASIFSLIYEAVDGRVKVEHENRKGSD